MRWAAALADSSRKYMQLVYERSPTLTVSRARGFWITSHRRRMLPVEQFRLQGFDPSKIKALPSAVAMGRLAGNSMCLPVLVHLLDALLPKLFEEFKDAH